MFTIGLWVVFLISAAATAYFVKYKQAGYAFLFGIFAAITSMYNAADMITDYSNNSKATEDKEQYCASIGMNYKEADNYITCYKIVRKDGVLTKESTIVKQSDFDYFVSRYRKENQ